MLQCYAENIEMDKPEICTLASGSKGNSIYVRYKDTAILIDQGLSLKELRVRANYRGIDLSQTDALFVTHEHSDHVKGVGAFARAYGVPVHLPAACMGHFKTEDGDERFFLPDDCDAEIAVKDLSVKPFRVPHDAHYTVGYRISAGREDIAVATDLGFVSDGTLARLSGCKAVVLESNHDALMLEGGRYPRMLKARIAGRNGHLSNDACAETAAALACAGAQKIILAHLSEENNTPEIAFETSRRLLAKRGVKEGDDVLLYVADQFKPSGRITI